MTRKVTSYRLPEMTLNQIEKLAALTGSSDANVIAFAIDRMYQQEIKPMTSKLVTLRCSGNQSAYEAIDEAIKDEQLPADATLGPRERTGQGWFTKPDQEVLGSVTVRANESFYIVRRPPMPTE